MSIRFKHCGSGHEYWLEGTNVHWISQQDGKERVAEYYTPAEINKLFGNGTWIRLDEPQPTIQAENSAWQLNLREIDNQFYVTGLGVGIENTATSTTEVATSTPLEKGGAVASDGGSSSYYDIGLPQWLVDKIVERQEAGKAYVKTEELIEVAFANDFDASNIFKSLVRAWGAFNGAGKKGNSVDYDLNKMIYSTEKIRQRSTRKQGATQ